MKAVDLWTDGSGSGQVGPGGWGVILVYGAHEKELSGGIPKDQTSNSMELIRVDRLAGEARLACTPPTQLQLEKLVQ
ncbi:MAG: hypothetical protein JXA14_22995 [Anaerolineae bacterium]|nr:hypothetical protein [Anaerolineae bacterium]